MKTIGKILLWIVGLVVILVVTLPLWISPVARIGANIAVPKITGAPFHLDRFNLSADWFSLATDTIVVKDISIGGLCYEQTLNMPSFSFGGASKKSPDAAEKNAPKKDSTSAGETKKSDKKIIIDHLLLEDIVIVVGAVKIPVPKIELTGIGRKSNGTTMQEAWAEISEQVMKQASALGGQTGELINSIKTQDAGKILDAVRAVDPEKFDKHAEKAVNVLKGFLK